MNVEPNYLTVSMILVKICGTISEESMLFEIKMFIKDILNKKDISSIILTKKFTDGKNVQLTENHEQKGSIRVLGHYSQGDYAKEHCDEKGHDAQN